MCVYVCVCVNTHTHTHTHTFEEQARKLGFEIKKRNTHPEEALLHQAPRAMLPLPPDARPSNQSLPSAQDVEREKVKKENHSLNKKRHSEHVERAYA